MPQNSGCFQLKVRCIYISCVDFIKSYNDKDFLAYFAYFCSMILYNVSIKVDPEIHDDWLDWMKEVHLPAVMGTGCFLDHRFYKLYVDDSDGISYVIQYYCTDMSTLEQYQTDFGPALRNDTERMFGGKYIAFRTVMEQI